jgi:hypothetical protein
VASFFENTGRAPRAVAATLVVVSLGWAPAIAITGKVVDPEGSPVSGANACLIVDGAAGLCATTDERGLFDLIDSEVPRLRVSADGFVTRYVPAVTHEQPIALNRAASLRVRLVDAVTGEPLDQGQVLLDYSSGRRLGPFPVNRAGVLIRQLRPDEVMVTARAAGYSPPAAVTKKLTGGQESAVTLELEPDSEESDGDASPES